MRGYRWASLALLGVVAVVFATPARAQQVELKPAQKVKRDKYLITAEEIAERAELRDGYDVVKVLRNQWLRVTRGSGTALSASDPTSTSTKVPTACAHDPSTCEAPAPTASPVPRERGSPYADAGSSGGGISQAGPVLYIDDIKQDRLEDLRTVRPSEIKEIRYMTGNEASGRYGAGHEYGAILVTRKKPGS
jgi:hypothetical protein